MTNEHWADMINPNISRRSFLSKSISASLAVAYACSSLSVFAKAFQFDEQDLITLFRHEFTGFNGETLDPISGNYLLGNGYRAYNPTLMRFMSQDTLSPFAEAGVNAYQYCSGDPINRQDPTGHLDGLKLGLGIFAIFTAIAGLIAIPFTGGTSMAIAFGAIGSAAGALSGAFTVASAAVAEKNPDLADKFDIVSWSFTGIALLAGATGAVGEIAQSTKCSGMLGQLSKGKLGQSRYKVEIKFRPKKNIKARTHEAARSANRKMMDVEAGDAKLSTVQSELLVDSPSLNCSKMTYFDENGVKGLTFKTPYDPSGFYTQKTVFGNKGFLGSRMMKTYSLKRGAYSWKGMFNIANSSAKQVGALGSGFTGIVAKAVAMTEKNAEMQASTFSHVIDLSENQDRIIAPGLSRTCIISADANPASINNAIRQGIF
ncbi:RHS repeat-associated core domain-containing protein [Vibrio cholerae]|uniref:RHS repeat-associated core domain-containing protein n=1 Tax=Vibrio cholerae TaxID=666 RepID=UPI00096BC54A|nr:RHS repeat-associated core domain-containing protein [Vibrio cholerae]EGR2120137.1 RHS repeat-associated core domain-containing protein [Vibrio cholerae]EHY0954165.1 RHS repeat-associated core domain-containing protein [Vibrio cholerae]EJL6467526.1 RHS repeat-associated core domain-containing protein [Vibrio cholerae]EJL6848749.1 RHS repeat-associated core domain-containing protein [Vibrio cholerae]EJL6909185.1 RHS repeat-associated core domain-containing protein [Vibrio cholerae]